MVMMLQLSKSAAAAAAAAGGGAEGADEESGDDNDDDNDDDDANLGLQRIWTTSGDKMWEEFDMWDTEAASRGIWRWLGGV